MANEINLNEYEPLVHKLARKHYHKGQKCELEDLLQVGRIGLVQASNKFDVTRGIKFITYASWYIEYTIVRWLKDHGALIRIPSYININELGADLPTAMNASDLSPEADMDKLTSTPIDEIESQIVLESLLAILDERAKGIFQLYYLEHKTLDEIATEYSVSSQRVHQIIHGGLQKLREAAKKNGFEAVDFLTN